MENNIHILNFRIKDLEEHRYYNTYVDIYNFLWGKIQLISFTEISLAFSLDFKNTNQIKPLIFNISNGDEYIIKVILNDLEKVFQCSLISLSVGYRGVLYEVSADIRYKENRTTVLEELKNKLPKEEYSNLLERRISNLKERKRFHEELMENAMK